ncbi:Nonsense-mediated mRNA decay protein 5, partial [Exophiala xenobiotica]
REDAVKASDGASDTLSEYASDDDAEDWADEPAGEQGQEWANINTEALPDTKGDIKDESQAYLDFLSEEAKKFGALADDDDDSILDEDSLLESPLDKFDPYGAFRESLGKLQTEQPQLYQNLTSILEPGDREVLQSVVAHAVQTHAAQGQVPA